MNFLQQQWTICKSYFPARLSLTTLTKCSGVVTNFFVYLLFQQSMVSFISELIAWLSHTLLSKSQSRLEPFGLYSYQKGRNKICVLLILNNWQWSLVATSGSFQRVRWREQRRLRGQPYDQNISYRPAPQGATPHLPEIHSGPKDKSWGVPNGRDRFRFGQKASSHYFQVSSFLHDIHSWFLLRSGAVNITVALLWWPLCCIAASSPAI